MERRRSRSRTWTKMRLEGVTADRFHPAATPPCTGQWWWVHVTTMRIESWRGGRLFHSCNDRCSMRRQYFEAAYRHSITGSQATQKPARARTHRYTWTWDKSVGGWSAVNAYHSLVEMHRFSCPTACCVTDNTSKRAGWHWPPFVINKTMLITVIIKSRAWIPLPQPKEPTKRK